MKRERFMRYLYISLTGAGAIVLSILFFFLLFRIQEVKGSVRTLVKILMPFIYGAVIAYLLTPICNTIEKYLGAFLSQHMKAEKRAKKLTAAGGIFLSLTLAFLLCYLLLSMVLPQVFYSVRGVVNLLPSNVEKWTEWLEGILSDNQVLVNYVEWVSDEILDNVDGFIRNNLLPNMQMILSGVSSGVISVFVVVKNLLIGIIAAVYMMSNRKRFAAQGKKLIYSIFKTSHANLLMEEIHFMDHVFGGFIIGKLLDSLIIGCICFVGLTLLKMPYTMLISVIVGVTNIIPFFGPYFGAIPSALLILMVNPRQCVYFLIFILVLQQFDGNILGPKILGDSTGLSGFWVLFSILLFGGMLGFIGMVIGVPTFAVIYNLVKRLAEHSLRRRRMSCETLDYVRLRSVTEEGEYVYETPQDADRKKRLGEEKKQK